MLKHLFALMLVVVVLCLVEYSVFQLQNTSVVIVAMRFFNQSDSSVNSNQMLKRFFGDILKSREGEGEPELETDLIVGDTGRKYPLPVV